jgi:predicted DNA-binding transcriptional regulator AlpA
MTKKKEEAQKVDLEIALTEKQAAEFLGYSRSSLNQWRVLGKGPKFIKYKSRSVRYRKCDLIEWRDSESAIVQSTAESKVI